MQYLFGDSDLAARRLLLLADVFAPTTRAFLADAVTEPPRLAADLGCGPGRTTHLLSEMTGCERAVGLDNSHHYIDLASRTASAGVSFHLHDVATVPFPAGPCDLIFCRFVLTHQAEPEAIVARWAAQLSPGGTLLLEETDSIHTRQPVFAAYIEAVEAALAAQGLELYIGRRLHAMPDGGGLARRSSKIGRLPVRTDLAARMFSMNIQTWKHSRFVQENFSAQTIRGIEDGLAELSAAPTDENGIEWRLRQMVFERVA